MQKQKEILIQNKLYQEGNNLFVGLALPSLVDYTLFGAFSSFKITNFLINHTGTGVIVIPCDKFNNRPMIEKMQFIDNSTIVSLRAENGNFGFYKINIIGNAGVIFAFQISKYNRMEIDNDINNFINSYVCENAGLILKGSNKVGRVVIIIIFIILLFIAALGFVSLIIG